jgi:hypothetical protein
MAALIAVITGGAAIVSFIASLSVRDAVTTVAPFAGGAYVVLPPAVLAYGMLRRRTFRERNGYIALTVALALVVWVFLDPDLRNSLDRIALAGIGSAILLAYDWLPRWWRTQRARQQQTCPDCKENVKPDARVCRYCGWRFAPVPPLEP